MTTRTVNGNTYYVKSNRAPRALVSLADIADADARADFDYIDAEEHFSPRLFNYRGEWYDSHEFTRAGDDVRALGFDGVQGESYFSAVAISYFDRDGNAYDDEVVVGYLHW